MSPIVRSLCLVFILCLTGFQAPPAVGDSNAPALDEAVDGDQDPTVPGFDGLWETNHGRVRLTQRKDQVRGHYSSQPASQLTGQCNSQGRLEFRYLEPDAQGVGWFELSGDGLRFQGQWRASGTKDWQPWNGLRVIPVPGKSWLVVLEAHWETGLSDEPYSFGEMLESFFRMGVARDVHTRHRFFHDRGDLRRLCREVAFLAEPVVLLISSHGSPTGVLVNGDEIDARWLGKSLIDLGHLQLLHLSSCDMMSGAFPVKLLAELPPGQSFPISGYATTVAWDTSAIADFLYLSLILIRGMTPTQAMEESYQLAPFTGDAAVDGSRVAPLGLRVLPPR